MPPLRRRAPRPPLQPRLGAAIHHLGLPSVQLPDVAGELPDSPQHERDGPRLVHAAGLVRAHPAPTLRPPNHAPPPHSLLSATRRQELLFKTHDLDGSGTLEVGAETNSLLSDLQVPLSRAGWRTLDFDGNGKVNATEFERWLGNDPDLLFWYYDGDRSGWLSADELMRLLVDMGVPRFERFLIAFDPRVRAHTLGSAAALCRR